VRVLSFNIRNGDAGDGPNAWPHRSDLVIELLRDVDADIVGLQEVLDYQLREILQALPQYEFVGVGREDGHADGEYAPVLFRSGAWECEDAETFWLSETPDVPGSRSWQTACCRICTRAALGGLTVFNCHLDHVSQEAREKGMALILERISQTAGAAILMGDFNAGEANRAYRLPLEAGMVDSFRQVHPDVPEPGTYTGFSVDLAPGEKIDHLFVRGLKVVGASVVPCGRDGRPASDHHAVYAEVTP
jgi:endonuclease/exonuclease/phosphatase family metal-dependent hydrolase